MKTLLIAISFLTLPTMAQTIYECQSIDGSQALLSIQTNKNEIYWKDLTHSSETVGRYQGIDKAPYNKSNNSLVFRAEDYEFTEDSAWYYKIEPDYEQMTQFKVIEIFNNDDHEEFETVFKCK